MSWCASVSSPADVPHAQLPVRPLTQVVALALVPLLVVGSTQRRLGRRTRQAVVRAAHSMHQPVTGVTLLLLGIVRAWDDVHTDRTSTWINLGAAGTVRAARLADRDDVSTPERVMGAAVLWGSSRVRRSRSAR
jgi:hypothetical protein